MSVKIIRALLVADAALLALVPASRIVAGVLPQGVALPAIGIREISLVEEPRIDAQAPYTIVEARVEVMVAASTYAAKVAVRDAMRIAANYERGTIAGAAVISVRRTGNGPDGDDAEAEFYTQTVDFKVVYNEPN